MKCVYCKEEITGTAYITKNRKRYHNSCYDKYISGLEKQDHVVSSKISSADKEELINYILKIFNSSKLPHVVSMQINQYLNKLNLSPQEILDALRYFVEVLERPIEKNSIGIVPYVVDEAREFYQSVAIANQSNQNKSITRPELKHISITKPDYALSTIDIGSL